MASVDVVIPNYNYGRYLRECVESVQRQGIDDLRILIVDNASTDDSVPIARELAAADPRIEVRAREKNLGAHASFNEGVNWAASDYFTVLCADDRMAPGALRRSIAALEQDPKASFVHGRTISVFNMESGEITLADPQPYNCRSISGEKFIEQFCRNAVNDVSGCTVLVRTAYQKQAGHYRDELPHTDDFEMWMRLALLGPVLEIHAIQGISLIHGANQSSHYHDKQTRDLIALKEAFDLFFQRDGRQIKEARRLHSIAVASIGERAYWSAISHLVRGYGLTGLALIKLAFRLCPKTIVLPPLGYLYRIDSPLDKARDRLSEALTIMNIRNLIKK